MSLQKATLDRMTDLADIDLTKTRTFRTWKVGDYNNFTTVYVWIKIDTHTNFFHLLVFINTLGYTSLTLSTQFHAPYVVLKGTALWSHLCTLTVCYWE